MTRKRTTITAVSAVLALMLVTSIGPVARDASALSFGGGIGTLIKIGGIAFAVDRFGGEIDKFINKFISQKGDPYIGKSKVVPILRVTGGVGGTAVGAAQVVGPPSQVDTVQAVASIELSLGSFRGRALIPVSTRKDLTGSIKGVGGVGVSAEIKFSV